MHLRGSRTGPRDHICNIGDQIRATVKVKDKHDRIVVLEKVDGSNVGVAKINNVCIPLVRSGYPAISSKYLQHKLFAEWVYKNIERFDGLLSERERVCGEWMAMAHGTRYNLFHEPFVVFDIMTESSRICFDILQKRSKEYEFINPHVLHIGGSLSIEDAMNKLGTYGFHGALDPAEGGVWRIERNELTNRFDTSSKREWIVENLVKYVRLDKEDGKYFMENEKDAIWNWYPKTN